MNLNILIAFLAAVLILIVGGVLAYVFYFRQRTRRLKDEFGPEYDRAVEGKMLRRRSKNARINSQISRYGSFLQKRRNNS